jgi:hypothetical protein
VRELLRAVWMDKPIITLVEPDASHGGISLEELAGLLESAVASLDEWGLEVELLRWGLTSLPTAVEIYDAMFARPPIEFCRLGPFQLVTLQMLAETALDDDQKPTFVQGGGAHVVRTGAAPPLPPARGGSYHVFVSAHNPGATELIDELKRSLNLTTLKATSDPEHMGQCVHMLVYLTGRTWANEETSANFERELRRAMELGVHVLPVHEMVRAVVLEGCTCP